ncbi:alpha/beta fold hydrolase [Paraburkholderia caballeronis]|uniref:alpha/beta fold hydrolase n=1 Tax=Paraburkholderia caballeronis TaxID=416943 RepID=UPI001064D9B6|nr:alpha/beta hydrolase [Paraburkholderia caballeronis]TDV15020.1 alpha-beta hydrolase superfamily lysophospholipase [Paraburkholderia caballeronis]TDV16855.1 alpha-beta hydrolase superfamily lysophospholipase [Paraburkholderia caballeronis]TDV25756.1 alpha-beta hydrolase superfamily lysophospholipase [Paraburkholderia caballeronis]
MSAGTWILLRGLTREARHWAGFAQQLARAAGDVLPVDLPGNGALARRPSPASVAGYVDAVRRDASARGAHGPYRVLAMSLGGMVAAAWAAAYPDDVAQLVLVNTSMRPYSRAHERLRPAAWPGLARVALHWGGHGGDDPAERLIHALTCNRRDTLAADLALWRAIRDSAPVSRANALRQLAAAARFSVGDVPRCPVLVLSSHGDRLVAPVCSARLARAWRATHVEHPWAGHDLPHDDPQWLVAALCAWRPAGSMRALNAPDRSASA